MVFSTAETPLSRYSATANLNGPIQVEAMSTTSVSAEPFFTIDNGSSFVTQGTAATGDGTLRNLYAYWGGEIIKLTFANAGLVTADDYPILHGNDYSNIFEGNSGLTSVPVSIPANSTAAVNTYSGCASIPNYPSISGGASGSFSGFCDGCTNVVDSIPTIPAGCTDLSNSFRGNTAVSYTAGALANITTHQLAGTFQNCGFSQAEIDSILADLESAVAANQITTAIIGTDFLTGGTNAAPSAAGSTSIANIQAALAGSVIDTN